MNDLVAWLALWMTPAAPKLWLAAAVTFVFAGFGRVVRGVTDSGAVAGAVVCFVLLAAEGWGGFAGLCTVFLLTWGATRFGYARKQKIGKAESRGGRTAAQVVANLGVATLCTGVYFIFIRGGAALLLASGAALAEAAGDTVSSEIGQAIGGKPRLITTWKEVATGVDGAVTLAGTTAGIGAAVVVSAIYAFGERIGWRGFVVSGVAGILGTFVDSLLGATIERRGVVRNNVVNFLSTLVAAGIALVAALM